MGLFSKFLRKSAEKPNQEPIPKLEYNGGTKYASNEFVDAYVDFEELGGYPFVKTAILGLFSTRTKKDGCTLTFKFENGEEITIESDNSEIDSQQVNKSKIYFTPIDFEITEEELATIHNNVVAKVIFKFKRESIKLDKI